MTLYPYLTSTVMNVYNPHVVYLKPSMQIQYSALDKSDSHQLTHLHKKNSKTLNACSRWKIALETMLGSIKGGINAFIRQSNLIYNGKGKAIMNMRNKSETVNWAAILKRQEGLGRDVAWLREWAHDHMCYSWRWDKSLTKSFPTPSWK